MTDIEKLINSHFPFIENILKEYGEFFPIGAVLDENNEISPIKPEIEGEHPESTEVIKSLRRTIRSHRPTLRIAAIFYDVRLGGHEQNAFSDAIAVHIESKTEEPPFVVYYPYLISVDKTLEFGKAWKEKTDRTIWTDLN
jgi:hypothetical protein